MTKIELWFPSHNLNLGILSKSLRGDITLLTEELGFSIDSTYFEDLETFIIEGNFKTPENQNYLINTLQQKYGMKRVSNSVYVDDIVLGRVIHPGNVGFGVFMDIGIRPSNDVLLSLIDLRATFTQSKQVSTRKIIDAYGIIDHFPLELQIKAIDPKSKQVNVTLSSKTKAMFSDWVNEGLQRLLITKYINYHFEKMLSKLGISKFIEEIEYFDPITTVITCKKRTRASGLISLLGPHLGPLPIGLFNVEKIRSISDL